MALEDKLLAVKAFLFPEGGAPRTFPHMVRALNESIGEELLDRLLAETV